MVHDVTVKFFCSLPFGFVRIGTDEGIGRIGRARPTGLS
jgi:hypothetical protein